MDTQSVHAVIYNDDLLIEILLRLPVISLVLFKSVCKRWLSLISNPTFYLRRSQNCNLDPPSGLLLKPNWRSDRYRFLSFDTQVPCKSSILKNPFIFGSKLHDVKILQSCNGLLLCFSYTNYNYYVYNPCINLLKMVPQCSMIRDVHGTKIAFDPTKSPQYKVIQAVLVNNSIQMQTYSSETDLWSVGTSRYPHHSYFLSFGDGVYWNDALYWLNRQDNNPLLFRLDTNVEHQALTTIKPPRTFDGKMYRPDFKLFVTCGCLLLLCRQRDSSLLMDVYEMRKGYSEWLLKYRVNLNDDVSCLKRSWTYPYILSIVLGEREEDSFIVIHDSKKIYQYKPVSKTSHELYVSKSAYHSHSHSFQFTESFAGVGL